MRKWSIAWGNSLRVDHANPGTQILRRAQCGPGWTVLHCGRSGSIPGRSLLPGIRGFPGTATIACIRAQSRPSGRIGRGHGKSVRPSGAIVPGATVKLLETDSGRVHTLTRAPMEVQSGGPPRRTLPDSGIRCRDSGLRRGVFHWMKSVDRADLSVVLEVGAAELRPSRSRPHRRH